MHHNTAGAISKVHCSPNTECVGPAWSHTYLLYSLVSSLPFSFCLLQYNRLDRVLGEAQWSTIKTSALSIKNWNFQFVIV